jgi:hypothetical protein
VLEGLVVVVLVAAFAAVALVAGFVVHRIWTATEPPPAQPSQRES